MKTENTTVGTPYSNTGGKCFEADSMAAGELQGEVLIDTISITMQSRVCTGGNEALSRWVHSDTEIVGRVQALLRRFFGDAIKPQKEVGRGMNAFESRVDLEKGGFVAFGGNNHVRTPEGVERRHQRLQINLKGEACALVKDWQRVYDALCAANVAGYDVRITRLDLACDFHDGQKTVADARAEFESGGFNGRGRPPKGQFIDDLGSGDGCTFYVGARGNGKYFRAYEKGKQLGDKNSPWVRYECQWSNDTKRDIPFDAVIRPRDYLAGSYKALSFIAEVVEVIRTASQAAKISYAHAKYWCRLQYGKLLHYATRGLGLSPESAYQEFFNADGFPCRLIQAPSAHYCEVTA
jgi:phage replication initiation protein